MSITIAIVRVLFVQADAVKPRVLHRVGGPEAVPAGLWRAGREARAGRQRPPAEEAKGRASRLGCTASRGSSSRS
jgi:hypothetical protein